MFPKLRKVILTSGEIIDVSDGVTAIVGPNNAGKSLLLSELQRWITMSPGQQPAPPMLVLGNIEAEVPTVEDFNAWLTKTCLHRGPGFYLPSGQIPYPHFVLPNNNLILDNQVPQLVNSSGRLSILGNAFTFYAGAGGTRDMANGTGTVNMQELPQNPLQHLYLSRELENEISSLVKRAFNVPLVVNRYGGSQINVHLGSVSAPETPPPGTKEYLAEITALPQVQTQGDGVKAFIGMLLAIRTADYKILLIDEPETFLHPPQAYLLGQILAEQHDRNTQVVVATHSSDIIQGLTSARASVGAVSIVRLTRKDNVNHVAQLSMHEMRGLYGDPLIKYYSILDGLFSHGAVVCESDSDCTYYRAVLDSIGTLEDGTPASSISLHFTHCSGKARLPKAIRALRAAKVPVACVVDIDILQNENEFKDLIASCGDAPENYMPLRKIVASAVSSRDERLERAKVKAELNQLLDSKRSSDLSTNELSRLTAALKPKNGWRQFKLAGYRLLSGEARISFDKLVTALRQLGIFMVDVGELERFHPEVSADNKAEWLRTVLEQKLYEKSIESKKFVTAIASSILQRQ